MLKMEQGLIVHEVLSRSYDMMEVSNRTGTCAGELPQKMAVRYVLQYACYGTPCPVELHVKLH